MSIPETSVSHLGVDVSRPVIEAVELRKEFGDFVAVDDISFAVPRGEFFGLLGPNGAGKSTTMRMIGAVSHRSGGQLSVLDRDPNTEGPQIRAQLGVVPQEDNLDLELSVTDNLYSYGRFFGLSRTELRARIPELLEFAQLPDRAKTRVENLSGGMRRRLTIARSLINSPSLLLLDEPTTGLDPQARHILWDRLYRLKDRGTTMVLTTHFMDEAEQLCDRLVVVDQGQIMAEGSPRELIRSYATREVLELRFATGKQEQNGDLVRSVLGERNIRVEVLPDRVLVYADNAEEVSAMLTSYNVHARSSLIRRCSLEDVFLRLTGRSLID
ncbi:ABC transporter ATP-binding protein [Micrococcoides hystricis]|uniref:ABC transporter ATP-binding protein n=1 Tax=Micrococcoides hystricis TaxID=1572761 RepID=A0ABV6P9B0_9MICC